MKYDTPWIVVKFGPEVPPGVLRIACLRCGDVNDTHLPVSCSTLVTGERAFNARHKDCKESAP